MLLLRRLGLSRDFTASDLGYESSLGSVGQMQSLES